MLSIDSFVELNPISVVIITIISITLQRLGELEAMDKIQLP